MKMPEKLISTQADGILKNKKRGVTEMEIISTMIFLLKILWLAIAISISIGILGVIVNAVVAEFKDTDKK